MESQKDRINFVNLWILTTLVPLAADALKSSCNNIQLFIPSASKASCNRYAARAAPLWRPNAVIMRTFVYTPPRNIFAIMSIILKMGNIRFEIISNFDISFQFASLHRIFL
jgi:hypothetical protein